jgi:hypothetical protein
MPRLAQFLGEMNFSGKSEIGFDKILLVEGPTDVTTFQQFLRMKLLDHKILLLALHGQINGNMASQLEEILRITSNVSAIIDSEKSSPEAPMPQQRKEFVDLCQRHQIDCHVLERRSTESYFPDAVVKQVFGSSFHAPQPYEDFKEMQPRWNKNANWRVARAMTIEDIALTDLGKFLDKL